jgi:asparagine synthase (glutamine-hydrolysing)
MTHRGPDGEGLWIRKQGDVGLAHRRLSIVDLSDAGRQPMSNEDGTVWVTYNGEIYNHVELRRQLERKGHVFRSHCDTEVLVHLYEEEGPAMVERLIGMFAFGLWDERREQLVLARDRLGIKPLYWTEQNGRLGFASEIKALLALLPRREVDPVALRHYLSFVAIPPPRTLFEGVSKLAPATVMVARKDSPPAFTRYWDPLTSRVEGHDDATDWETELRTALERSIERRMMSDVPVGVFLSGGVDSSTNVALMSQLIDEPVNTFSIGFEDAPAFTEFNWARRVAKQFQTNHFETTINSRALWEFMSALVHHQDEPIADPVCVPLYFVSKLAKENGVTVVHVGEGADELLAGYPTYVTANRMARGPWARLRALPAPVRNGLARVGAGALSRVPSREIEMEALLRATQPDGKLWWGGAVAFYEQGARRVATEALLRDTAGHEEPRDIVADIAAEVNGDDPLTGIIYQDLRLRLPELLLMRVDKLTMANSIEARVPFLDHQLVEMAMAMPSSEKIRDGIGKHVLKRAVSDLLPDEIVWRPKQGFGAPVADWFRGELADDLARTLQSSSIHSLGYLNPQRMQEILEIHRSGRSDRSFQLWNLLNLCSWFDYWVAGEAAPEPAATS